MTISAPFDRLAADYDARFTTSLLGRAFRRAVWNRLDRAFPARSFVLELGCGTGEDALHLAERGTRVLATDRSAAMLEIAERKVVNRRPDGAVEFRQLAIEQLGDLLGGFRGRFDGAFSNFGALNCVADLPAVARALAPLVVPGGHVVLCFMGPLVPWEWGWFLGRGKPRDAFRRLVRGGIAWRGIAVHYPSISSVRRAFRGDFALEHTAGLGVLLPPSYAEEWARQHPRTIDRLERWERHIESWPLLPWLADHFLLEFVRT